MATVGKKSIPKKLFGTSGVRGIMHQELDCGLIFNLGMAVATSLPPHARALIATDSRESRIDAKTTFIMGMMASGMHVIDTGYQVYGNDPSLLGIFPTPVLAFITKEMGVDVGIMVTASHNPPEYNGFKFFNADGIGYSRRQEQVVEDIYNQQIFREGIACDYMRDLSIRRRYYDYVKSNCRFDSFKKRFRIVIDSGNGAASKFVSGLFWELGLEIFPINDVADGTFPGRNPEPRPDTLGKTYEFLKSNRADLAICFDGDADRVVFMDKHGFIGFDEAVTFMAALEVKASGKKRVATTVEAGRLLDIALGPLGVEVIRGIVGDVPVAYLARDTKAAIGVEPVGVYIYPDHGYFPDSICAVLTLLKSIEDVGEIREFFQGIPPLFKRQQKIACPNDKKLDVLNHITKNHELLGKGSVNTIDGVRIDFENGWLLIRPSGTEPIIRIIAESLSESDTEKMLSKAGDIVQDYAR
ncbi:MAG: hypothetical protein NTX46_03385 [Chloroflexi bacterium]|nr:hypothetical protein [Chloroflexota bacterium]